jgi:hypothetical protein
MSAQVEPIERLAFEAAELVAEHPPVWSDWNKRVVYDVACPPGAVHRGRLEYSRWKAMALPERAPGRTGSCRVLGCPGFYDYDEALHGAVEWHVNFADPHLFVAYGSPLFAQDEMQVAEHPALGALKEALDARGCRARTVEADGPTPVLVAGVERRCRIATAGLYGNAFARASAESVRRATTRIAPPTATNLIAMAAPPGGHGFYTTAQIEDVLVTACTGFRAAMIESARLRGVPCPTVVHTGHWGCGAFGGNRELMAALQVLAARWAGVDLLAFHTGPPGGDEPLRTAQAHADSWLAGDDEATPALIARIASHRFEWGVSDGN